MKPKRIVFLEVENEDRDEVLSVFPDAVIESEVLSEDEIIRKHNDAEILCTFIYSPVTKKVIHALPNLKLIATRSVGYNHIDLKAAREKGIVIANVPDYGSHVIAEHVFALLLSSIRRVVEGEERTSRMKFEFQGLRGIALKGKTLGIIGAGRIGLNVARIASLGFLMKVLAYDVYQDPDHALEYHFQYATLDEIYEKCDIISLHCPLLPSTKHLINGEAIRKMKDGVVIINTARGGIIDTKALIKGLKSRKILKAALDVVEHEQNIEENKELVEMENVIITPHIAFFADDSMHRMYSEAMSDIKLFMETGAVKHAVVGE